VIIPTGLAVLKLMVSTDTVMDWLKLQCKKIVAKKIFGALIQKSLVDKDGNFVVKKELGQQYGK